MFDERDARTAAALSATHQEREYLQRGVDANRERKMAPTTVDGYQVNAPSFEITSKEAHILYLEGLVEGQENDLRQARRELMDMNKLYADIVRKFKFEWQSKREVDNQLKDCKAELQEALKENRGLIDILLDHPLVGPRIAHLRMIQQITNYFSYHTQLTHSCVWRHGVRW